MLTFRWRLQRAARISRAASCQDGLFRWAWFCRTTHLAVRLSLRAGVTGRRPRNPRQPLLAGFPRLCEASRGGSPGCATTFSP